MIITLSMMGPTTTMDENKKSDKTKGGSTHCIHCCHHHGKHCYLCSPTSAINFSLSLTSWLFRTDLVLVITDPT